MEAGDREKLSAGILVRGPARPHPRLFAARVKRRPAHFLFIFRFFLSPLVFFLFFFLGCLSFNPGFAAMALATRLCSPPPHERVSTVSISPRIISTLTSVFAMQSYEPRPAKIRSDERPPEPRQTNFNRGPAILGIAFSPRQACRRSFLRAPRSSR